VNNLIDPIVKEKIKRIAKEGEIGPSVLAERFKQECFIGKP
jgi:hypothetical protein